MESALVDRSVTQVTDRNFARSVVLLRKSNAGRKRGLTSHDSVPTVKMFFFAKEMHRSALAPRAAGDFSKQFRHALPRSHAPSQSMTVIPIGGDHRISLIQSRNGSHRHGFLTDIEMAKPFDLRLHEGLGGLLFKTPDQNHSAKQIHPLGGCEGRQNCR